MIRFLVKNAKYKKEKKENLYQWQTDIYKYAFDYHYIYSQILSKTQLQILKDISKYFPNTTVESSQHAFIAANFANIDSKILREAANALDKSGETVLWVALDLGWVSGIEKLLQMGANPNRPHRKTEKLPLHWAIDNLTNPNKVHQATRVMQLLLNYGANPENRFYQEQTVLEYAKKVNCSLAIALIEKHTYQPPEYRPTLR